jgi:hypothetical protein
MSKRVILAFSALILVWLSIWVIVFLITPKTAPYHTALQNLPNLPMRVVDKTADPGAFFAQLPKNHHWIAMATAEYEIYLWDYFDNIYYRLYQIPDDEIGWISDIEWSPNCNILAFTHKYKGAIKYESNNYRVYTMDSTGIKQVPNLESNVESSLANSEIVTIRELSLSWQNNQTLAMLSSLDINSKTPTIDLLLNHLVSGKIERINSERFMESRGPLSFRWVDFSKTTPQRLVSILYVIDKFNLETDVVGPLSMFTFDNGVLGEMIDEFPEEDWSDNHQLESGFRLGGASRPKISPNGQYFLISGYQAIIDKYDARVAHPKNYWTFLFEISREEPRQSGGIGYANGGQELDYITESNPAIAYSYPIWSPDSQLIWHLRGTSEKNSLFYIIIESPDHSPQSWSSYRQNTDILDLCQYDLNTKQESCVPFQPPAPDTIITDWDWCSAVP